MFLLDGSWKCLFLNGDWSTFRLDQVMICPRIPTRLQINVIGDYATIMFDPDVKVLFVTELLDVEECAGPFATIPVCRMARVRGKFVLFARLITPEEARAARKNAIAEVFQDEEFAERVMSFEPPLK